MRPGQVSGSLPWLECSPSASVTDSIGRKAKSRSGALDRIRVYRAAGYGVLIRTHPVELGQDGIDIPRRSDVADEIRNTGGIGSGNEAEQIPRDRTDLAGRDSVVEEGVADQGTVRQGAFG